MKKSIDKTRGFLFQDSKSWRSKIWHLGSKYFAFELNEKEVMRYEDFEAVLNLRLNQS